MADTEKPHHANEPPAPVRHLSLSLSTECQAAPDQTNRVVLARSIVGCEAQARFPRDNFKIGRRNGNERRHDNFW